MPTVEDRFLKARSKYRSNCHVRTGVDKWFLHWKDDQKATGTLEELDTTYKFKIFLL